MVVFGGGCFCKDGSQERKVFFVVASCQDRDKEACSVFLIAFDAIGEVFARRRREGKFASLPTFGGEDEGFDCFDVGDFKVLVGGDEVHCFAFSFLFFVFCLSRLLRTFCLSCFLTRIQYFRERFEEKKRDALILC